MLFWFQDEMRSQLWITPKRLDTFKNVAIVDLNAFSGNFNLMTLKSWTLCGNLVIDDGIQFF
jgi:hypothetical protein